MQVCCVCSTPNMILPWEEEPQRKRLKHWFYHKMLEQYFGENWTKSLMCRLWWSHIGFIHLATLQEQDHLLRCRSIMSLCLPIPAPASDNQSSHFLSWHQSHFLVVKLQWQTGLRWEAQTLELSILSISFFISLLPLGGPRWLLSHPARTLHCQDVTFSVPASRHIFPALPLYPSLKFSSLTSPLNSWFSFCCCSWFLCCWFLRPWSIWNILAAPILHKHPPCVSSSHVVDFQ